MFVRHSEPRISIKSFFYFKYYFRHCIFLLANCVWDYSESAVDLTPEGVWMLKPRIKESCFSLISN